MQHVGGMIDTSPTGGLPSGEDRLELLLQKVAPAALNGNVEDATNVRSSRESVYIECRRVDKTITRLSTGKEDAEETKFIGKRCRENVERCSGC